MDVPFRQPNCIGSILSLTSSINHETTTSSKKKGLSEIGLISLPRVGFVILGIGMILDSFHEIGITPDDKDTLKIVAAGVASSKANCHSVPLFFT